MIDCETCPADDSYWCDPCCMIYDLITGESHELEIIGPVEDEDFDEPMFSAN